MILNDTVLQALTAGHLAHLVTLNKDGSPQVSIVWVGLDGDEIVCGHLTTHLYQKLMD
jgi:Pyridoxamine 5'-phosphate oxidase